MAVAPSYKCIIVLSDKASGSSALQNLLAMVADVHHVVATRHEQHETLYWTKAASVLGLPQVDLAGSEVPLPGPRARRDLEELLVDNLGTRRFDGADDSTLVFGGFGALCERFAPVFLEKSPHHLHQMSALELIERARGELPTVEFLVVGLVRNPLDTIYSAWRQWRTDPSIADRQWAGAYRNLLELRKRDTSLVVLRYEDMVAEPAVLAPVLEFAGAAGVPDADYLHRGSLGRGRRDRRFGYALSPTTIEVARAFDYTTDELTNPSWALWPAYRRVARTAHAVARPLRRARSRL